MALIDLGHAAVSLTGSQAGIVTDTVHGKAKIVEVRAQRIHEALDQGRIVLVAGFQGVSTDAEVTTLGRGGSDTTAVALAAALGADSATSSPTSKASSPPIRASSRTRASSRRSATTRCSSSPPRAPESCSCGSRVARNHGVILHVHSTFTGTDGT